MIMITKQKIAIGIVAGISIIALSLFFTNYLSQTDEDTRSQEVSTDDPIDIVLDFYNTWLDAVRGTSTSPYQEGLHERAILSEGLRNILRNTENRSGVQIDPVLCQETIPERITARVVSETNEMIRILVMARDAGITAQSTFTLKRLNDGWYIEEILCAPGEFDIPREFTFEHEGYILKSVPPPLNPEYWHLIFERDGILGHTVPLFFDAESSCRTLDGTTTLCDPNTFTEATKVYIRGQMTELGVEIKQLEFRE